VHRRSWARAVIAIMTAMYWTVGWSIVWGRAKEPGAGHRVPSASASPITSENPSSRQ
jgi:hypothetical protein